MNRNKGIRFFVDTIRDSTFLFFFFFKERKQTNKEPRNLVYIYIYIYPFVLRFFSYVTSIVSYRGYAIMGIQWKIYRKSDDDRTNENKKLYNYNVQFITGGRKLVIEHDVRYVIVVSVDEPRRMERVEDRAALFLDFQTRA